MTEQSELKAWLLELEAEQAAKALVIASLRQKLGLEPNDATSGQAASSTGGVRATATGTVTVPHHGQLRADTFFGLSVPEAIKTYLALMKRPQSPRAITDALQQGGVLSQSVNFYLNIATSLKRLRDAGVVVNTKEGWGLSVWYPNRKAAEAPKPKTKKKTRSVNRVARLSKSRAKVPRKAKGSTGWHDFLADYLRAGKSMKVAAADWKQRKAVST